MRRPDSPGGLAHLLLGQPELAEQYMRALALKGELPSYSGSEFQPSINITDLRDPEYLWLRRTVRYEQGLILPVVAGQFSQCAFSPVANASRVLAVVEQLILTNSSGAGFTFLVDCLPTTLIAAPASLPRSTMDDRAIPANSLQATPNFGLTNATAVAALLTGSGPLVIGVPATSTIVLPLNWVFTARQVLNTPAPSFLQVQCGTVATACHVAVVWRERSMLAAEQT